MERIAIVLALVWLLHVSGPPVCFSGMIKTPFDVELYTLGYDVFLANSNPKDAFSLAEKAVTALPNDAGWRYKAARSGEWSGNSVRALEHWYYLGTALAKADARLNALRLARGLQDSNKLKLLLEAGLDTADEQVLKEYIAACESLGVPDDAIAALARHKKSLSGKFALENLARLYEATGRTGDAIAVLQELSGKFGASSPVLLKSASLAYGMGDIQSAHRILNQGKDHIPSQDYEYWATLSDLNWAMQDTAGAVQASRLLVEQGHGRDVDYQRLIAATRDTDGVSTYLIALEAWQRTKQAGFFNALLETGIALKRFKDLDMLISKAGIEGALKTFEESSYFWVLRSQVYRGIGNGTACIKSYQEALRRAPEDGALAAGYIWLLLDLDRRKELRNTLKAWRGREKSLPELYEPFGAAYAHIGEYARALPLFQARYDRMSKDPSWLAAYADTLEQSGNPGMAYHVRLDAMKLARNRINESGEKLTEERRRLVMDYARLAMRVKPGDALDRQMRAIGNGCQDDASRELVAAWALATERNDVARLWNWKKYAAMARSPRWVELALALEENDRTRIADLLRNDLDQLPYHDAIDGAMRTGQRELAENLAFEWGDKNPADHLLYEQTRDIYGAHQSFFRYHLNLADRGGVGILENSLMVSQQVSRRLILQGEGVFSNYGAQKTGVIGSTAPSDTSGNMTMKFLMEKGELAVSAGGRNSLESFPFVTAALDYRLKNSWKLNLGLHYSDIADETVPLRIGGVKDMVSLSAEHRLTPRNTITGRVAVSAYRDQEERRLGSGFSYSGEFGHQITFAYPDFRLRLFGGYYEFTRNGMPAGKLLTLIPDGVEPTMNFFIPDTYGEAGAGFSFGEGSRGSYIREWRLFGGGDIIWNSRTDLGWRYYLGSHGPVFSLDKLSFSFSQDSGSYGTSDINTIFQLGYTYYFN